MEKNLLLLISILYLASNSNVDSSREVMRSIMENYFKPLDRCKKELNLPDSIYVDFYNFWTEGYQFKSNATGCAMICISARLNLIDPGADARINLKHLEKLIMRNGADVGTARQIMYFLYKCEKTATDEPNDCTRVLRRTYCFRDEIQKLNWAPDMKYLWKRL